MFNDISIVDSPGLDHHLSVSEAVRVYLEQADAFVIMLDSGKPLTKEERDFIKYIRNINKIFSLFSIGSMFSVHKIENLSLINSKAQYLNGQH